MAAGPTNFEQLREAILRQMETTTRLNEVILQVVGAGFDRTSVKHAVVELLNEGDIILTADRRIMPAEHRELAGIER